MGKRGKWKKTLILMLLFCLTAAFPVHASGQDVPSETVDVRIEQVQARMPQIRIYIGGSQSSSLDISNVEVYLDGNALENESLVPYGQEEMTCYLLLDRSLSMKEEDFEAAKEALISFIQGKKGEEAVKLFTFGDSFEMVLDGKETEEEAVSKIEGLVRDSQNTQLFEALKQMTEIAEQEGNESFRRRIAIIITDGSDDSLGVSTSQEALKSLATQGIAVYGMASAEGEQESINRFGEFIRQTGGMMDTWNAADIDEALQRIKDEIANIQVLTVLGTDNRVSYEMEELTVEFKQWNLTRTAGFYEGYWMPDREPPFIVQASQEGKQELAVTFSEPVEGMEQQGNYQLYMEEEHLAVPVSVQKTGECSVLLSFGEEFLNGRGSLKCVNMKDISMEANALEGEMEIELAGREESLEELPENRTLQFFRTWGWLIAVLAVFLLGIIILCILSRIKKRKEIVSVDGKLMYRDGAEVHKHVVVEKEETVRLTFYPAEGTMRGRQGVDYELHGSMIVGRSDMCDLYFDDAAMSRQHFALEYENGRIFITDLNTSNGTAVNGVRLHGRTLMHQNDVIHAGNTVLRLKWQEDGK